MHGFNPEPDFISEPYDYMGFRIYPEAFEAVALRKSDGLRFIEDTPAEAEAAVERWWLEHGEDAVAEAGRRADAAIARVAAE